MDEQQNNKLNLPATAIFTQPCGIKARAERIALAQKLNSLKRRRAVLESIQKYGLHREQSPVRLPE